MTKLKRVVLKEELVALTGDPVSAMLLSHILYWSERRSDADAFIEEERARDPEINMPLTHGWVRRSSAEFAEDLMGLVSASTIRDRLSKLCKAGWLDAKEDEDRKWDRTLLRRPNIHAIQKDLATKGFVLDGYRLQLSYPTKPSDEANQPSGEARQSEAESARSDAEAPQSDAQPPQSEADSKRSYSKTDLETDLKTERETRAREADLDKATPAVRKAESDSVTSQKEHTPESVRAWTLKQVKSFLPERDFSDHAEDIADTAAKAWQVGNGDVTPEAVASAAFGGGLSHSTTQLRSLKRFGETHGKLKLIAAATIGAKVHGRYAAGRLDGIARQWRKSAQSSSTRSIDNLVASGAIGAIGR